MTTLSIPRTNIFRNDFHNHAERFIFYFFLAACLIGLVSPNGLGNATVSRVFDLVLISLFVFAAANRISASVSPYAMVTAVYLAINFMIYSLTFELDGSPYAGGAVKNFVFSNKFLVLIFLSPFFVNKSLFSEKFMENVFLLLLFSALVKYFYVQGLGIDDRPKLLLENNYELMTLLLLFTYVVIARVRKGEEAPLWMLMTVSLVIVLSGSRSAVLGLVPVALAFYFRMTLRHILLGGLGFALMLILVYTVFASRGSSLEDIDRFRFFLLFLGEIREFGVSQILFGTFPLQPLDSYTCKSLHYYQSLFSSAGDGRCYAIIFHSFFMRVFFDHGLAGILICYVVIWKCLSLSGFSRKEIIVILSFPTFSALSVSAFGTSFVALPICMIIATKPFSRI